MVEQRVDKSKRILLRNFEKKMIDFGFQQVLI